MSPVNGNIIFFLQKGTDRSSAISHMEGKIPIDEKQMFRTAGHFCMGWTTVTVSVNV